MTDDQQQQAIEVVASVLASLNGERGDDAGLQHKYHTHAREPLHRLKRRGFALVRVRPRASTSTGG